MSAARLTRLARRSRSDLGYFGIGAVAGGATIEGLVRSGVTMGDVIDGETVDGLVRLGEVVGDVIVGEVVGEVSVGEAVGETGVGETVVGLVSWGESVGEVVGALNVPLGSNCGELPGSTC